MMIKSSTHTAIKFVILVLAVLMLAGCYTAVYFGGMAASSIYYDSKNIKINLNDLTIKSDLGVVIPINAPIVIHINVNNEEKYLNIYRIEKVRDAGTGTSGGDPFIVDMERDSRWYKSPLWYEAESSALESFRNLSTDVRIDREIDKPDNHDESLLWYENKAIDDSKSAYKLGLHYHLGKEIPFDYSLAKKWYLQSDIPAAKMNVFSMWSDENPIPWIGKRNVPSDIKILLTENARYGQGKDGVCGWTPGAKCMKETPESLIRIFRKDQELIVDTKGLNAYIFHISIDYCDRHQNISWPSKEKQLPNSFIVVKVYHTDGTDFGEYIFENNDNPYYHHKTYLRNVAYIAYNEVANKLVNSKPFVNHYQSLYK